MIKKEIESLVKEYFNHYHLKRWKVTVENRSFKQFGQCNNTRKTLRMSAKLCSINPNWVINRVIKHEIAHALSIAFSGHNSHWKQVCLAIGGDGKRCYDGDDTNLWGRLATIPMVEPIKVPVKKSKVFSWVDKWGNKVTITETYA